MFTITWSLQGAVQGIMQERQALSSQKAQGTQDTQTNLIRGKEFCKRAGPQEDDWTGQEQARECKGWAEGTALWDSEAKEKEAEDAGGPG